jgi:hypothetical protein
VISNEKSIRSGKYNCCMSVISKEKAIRSEKYKLLDIRTSGNARTSA